MTTLDWPTARHFQPSNMRWGARVPTSSWQAFYSGQAQSIAHAGQRIALSLTLPPVRSPLLAAEREAFLTSLAARGDWVRLGHFGRPLPQGNVGTNWSTVTVKTSVAAGASSVVLQGLRAANNLLGGSSFEIDTNADGTADGWVAFNGGAGDLGRTLTPQRIASTDIAGSWIQRLTISNVGNSVDSGFTLSSYLPISPSTPYALSAYVLPSVSGKVYASCRQYNSGGAQVGSDKDTPKFAAGGWSRWSVAFTSEATAAKCHLSVRGISANGESFDVDAVQLEPGASTSAYTGDATLAAGDVFSVAGQLLQVAYGGARANDAGEITGPLTMPLRAALTAGAAVTLARPTGTFQLTGSDYGSDYSAALVQQGVELQFLEAFA